MHLEDEASGPPDHLGEVGDPRDISGSDGSGFLDLFEGVERLETGL